MHLNLLPNVLLGQSSIGAAHPIQSGRFPGTLQGKTRFGAAYAIIILSEAKDLGHAGECTFRCGTNVSFWGQMRPFVQHDKCGHPRESYSHTTMRLSS
jgi:hypothetical protein